MIMPTGFLELTRTLIIALIPQVDARGQNFLHQSVLAQDVEAVIFLLSVRVDVNSKVQNPTLNTPLHFAVKGGSELLVRNLVRCPSSLSSCSLFGNLRIK